MSDPVTPNMNLVQPIVGVDSGIDAANAYNANYTTIDQHNHSVGSGVQITPSGININASLPFNNQAATGLGYANITTQGTGIPTPVNYSVYFSGNEFFVKDGAGNAVQITTGGNVNATSSGISSGTATASFVASVLVVNAASTTPANIQGGSVLLGNNTAGSKFLTLSPPNAMAANYQLFLPAIPAATSIMAIDASGNISGAYTVDNSTIDITGGNQIEVKASGIGTSQIASSAVTTAKIAAGNITTALIASAAVTPAKQSAQVAGISASTGGGYANSTTSLTTVAAVTVTLTGSRIVAIALQPDSNLGGGLGNISVTGSGVLGVLVLFRGATEIARCSYGETSTVPPGSISFIDGSLSSGSTTYTLKGQLASGGGTMRVNWSVLVAYET